MTLRDIAALRLRNQHVAGTHLTSAEEVVGWLGCVQSQEYAVAKWSLAQRASGFSDADVDTFLAEGRILRTHILRPTWHFVLPADIRWMMRLTGPRIAKCIRPSADVRVPPETVIQRALNEIRSALSGGHRMTRKQLTAVLVERGLTQDKREIVPIFMRAELDLVVTSGGLEGKVQTYALIDEIAPPAASDAADAFDRDWAVGELTRRYFSSHGPATVADFVWWSGLTVTDAKLGLAVNRGNVETFDVDGTTYWWAGEAGGDSVMVGSGRRPTVLLMQAYDEYIVAYRPPRDAINVDRHVSASAMQRSPFTHAVIADSQAVGWWRRTTTRDGYAIDVRLARPLTAAERHALDDEVSRHSAFVGAPVAIGTID